MISTRAGVMRCGWQAWPMERVSLATIIVVRKQSTLRGIANKWHLNAKRAHNGTRMCSLQVARNDSPQLDDSL